MTIASGRPAVRRVIRADLSTIEAFWTTLNGSDPQAEPCQTSLSHLVGLLADPGTVMLCSLLDERPVGLACFRKRSADSAELIYIEIAPGYRREGHATLLLNSGIFALLPVASLTVTVSADQQAAAAWLHRRGFRGPAGIEESLENESANLELRFDRPAHGGCDSCSHECGGTC